MQVLRSYFPAWACNRATSMGTAKELRTKIHSKQFISKALEMDDDGG